MSSQALVGSGWERVKNALVTPTDPNDLDGVDEETILFLSRHLDRFCRLYFRQKVEGIENVPRGATLVVGNHEAGISFPQVLGMGARWYLERGVGDPLRGMAHDMMIDMPLVGNFLVRAACVRAGHENADEVFRRGEKVLVFPGGDVDAFRSWKRRNVVDFNNRKGFIRLALRSRVSVTPVVFTGGQESFVVLSEGRQLARALGLKKIFRTEVCPIFLGLPWAVGVGPIFHLPLPSYSHVRFMEPISLEPFGPEDANDPAALDELYRRITGAMQAEMDRMVAKRRWPILG